MISLQANQQVRPSVHFQLRLLEPKLRTLQMKSSQPVTVTEDSGPPGVSPSTSRGQDYKSSNTILNDLSPKANSSSAPKNRGHKDNITLVSVPKDQEHSLEMGPSIPKKLPQVKASAPAVTVNEDSGPHIVNPSTPEEQDHKSSNMKLNDRSPKVNNTSAPKDRGHKEHTRETGPSKSPERKHVGPPSPFSRQHQASTINIPGSALEPQLVDQPQIQSQRSKNVSSKRVELPPLPPSLASARK
eukprot:TRINITY_DN10202_c0_g1_i2.p1 TRINITY_DN10202_c0_g1~~TRINITY_DN10202_c0_g1_i2.p1  ORF type:complete len:243 (-),score=44.88 TRINITY_DN10202_c0_g1_i2:4-732(-)